MEKEEVVAEAKPTEVAETPVVEPEDEEIKPTEEPKEEAKEEVTASVETSNS